MTTTENVKASAVSCLEISRSNRSNMAGRPQVQMQMVRWGSICQKSEVRGQKSEVRSQRSDVSGPSRGQSDSSVRGQKSEVRLVRCQLFSLSVFS